MRARYNIDCFFDKDLFAFRSLMNSSSTASAYIYIYIYKRHKGRDGSVNNTFEIFPVTLIDLVAQVFLFDNIKIIQAARGNRMLLIDLYFLLSVEAYAHRGSSSSCSCEKNTTDCGIFNSVSGRSIAVNYKSAGGSITLCLELFTQIRKKTTIHTLEQIFAHFSR